MRLILVWLINAAAIFLLPYILAAVHIKDFSTAMLVALVIGLLNTFIRPVLFVLTLPVNVLTLGLFTLVLNGLMFMGHVPPGGQLHHHRFLVGRAGCRHLQRHQQLHQPGAAG